MWWSFSERSVVLQHPVEDDGDEDHDDTHHDLHLQSFNSEVRVSESSFGSVGVERSQRVRVNFEAD